MIDTPTMAHFFWVWVFRGVENGVTWCKKERVSCYMARPKKNTIMNNGTWGVLFSGNLVVLYEPRLQAVFWRHCNFTDYDLIGI